MADLSSHIEPVWDVSTRLSRRFLPLVGLAVLAWSGAWVIISPAVSLALASAGWTVFLIAGGARGFLWIRAMHEDRLARGLARYVEKDSAAAFMTSAEGEIRYANASARNGFGDLAEATIGGVLKTRIADPSAALYRLQTRAAAGEPAWEEIVTRDGHLHLGVQKIGRDGLLWRLEDSREAAPDSAEIGRYPILSFGRNGIVLFMNDAARSLVGARLRAIHQLVEDPPLRNGQVHQVITPEGPARRQVTLIEAGIGRTEVILMPDPEDRKGDSASDAEAEFDTVPVPLLRLSPDGRILRANEKAGVLLGDAAPAGRHVSDLMQGLGRSINDWIEEALQDRARNPSEFLKATRRDKEVFLQVTLSPARVAGAKCLTAVLNDATELKSLEAQFVQSQKMQAIGQLAGGVAHDFNNLLTAISGHCDLLLLRHDRGDPDYSDLVQINQNANRAAGLVGQLLAFSRKQTLRPELVDMRDTLSDLTHLLNRLVGEKVRLTLRHDPTLMTVRVDKRQMEQVLMNLVVNARDAMPAGGEIVIETSILRLQEAMYRDDARIAPGEYVRVEVRDEGVGIPPDRLPKVFEPFYTTKRTGEGTGLGLSTAYGIVKQTGGYIFVESEPGEGTCFTLLFPAQDEVAATRDPAREQGRKPVLARGSGVVLLVEDEAPVRAFASRALRLRGYSVIEASNAEEALNILEDEELSIDIFVTDVVMPGLNGPAWVREALKNRPAVSVVFMSGYAEDVFGEGDGDEAVPGSVFLPKPFSLSQLVDTVQRQLA